MTNASNPLPRIEVFVTVVADRAGKYRIDEGIKDAAIYHFDSADYDDEPFVQKYFKDVPHPMLVRKSQSTPGACKAVHTDFGTHPPLAIPGQEEFEIIFCVAADAFSEKELERNVKIASDRAQEIYTQQWEALKASS